MPRLLEDSFAYGTQDGIPNSRPHFKIEMEENECLDNISAITKLSIKELTTAYYKPVNKNGPNGVKNDSKGPNDLPQGKIFYIQYDKILDKRLNIYKLFSVTTSIRCMYGPEEPMRNRYILFWETNNDGNAFKENKTGSYFGRKGRSGETTKPVGLGVTDGDGILNGESLRWIADLDENKIKFSNNGKFPEHAKEIDISFTCTMNIGEEGILKTFYKKIGSTYKHNLKGNIPMHDIGNGNFIWAKKVSRFINFRNYTFMPLPVDILNDKTFNTMDLFQIDSSLLTTFTPNSIQESTYTRKIYDFDKESFDRDTANLRTYQRQKLNSEMDSFFDIPSGTLYSINNPRQIIVPELKYYSEPELNFKHLPDQDGPVENNHKIITEQTPPIKEVTLKCSLPEWVARIKLLTNEATKIYNKLKNSKKPHFEHMNNLLHLSMVSKVRAMFPYSRNHIDDCKINIANEIPEELSSLKKNISDCFIARSEEGSEDERSYNDLMSKLEIIRNTINSKDLFEETKRYLGTKESTEWPYLFLGGLNDNQKKVHQEKTGNTLCFEINRAYTLFKDMEIYDVNANSKSLKTFFEKVYEEDIYIVINKVLEADEGKPVLYENAVFFLLNDSNLHQYISRSKGPSSLLVCMLDISKHFYSKVEFDANSLIKSFSQSQLHKLCVKLYWKTYLPTLQKYVEYKTSIEHFFNVRQPLKRKLVFIRDWVKKYSPKKLKIKVKINAKQLTGTGFDLIVLIMQISAFRSSINSNNKQNINTVIKEYLDGVSQVTGVALSGVSLFKGVLRAGMFDRICNILLLLQFCITIFKMANEIVRDSGDQTEKQLLFKDIVITGFTLMVYFMNLELLPATIFYLSIMCLNSIWTSYLIGGPLSQYVHDTFQIVCESNEYNDYKKNKKVHTLIKNINSSIFRLKNTEFDMISWRGAIPLMECGFTQYKKDGITIDDDLTYERLEKFVKVNFQYKIEHRLSNTYLEQAHGSERDPDFNMLMRDERIQADGIPLKLILKYYKLDLEKPKRHHDSWAPPRINIVGDWEQGEILENLNPKKRIVNGNVIFDEKSNNWFDKNMDGLFYL